MFADTTGEPVVIQHGTTGSAGNLLTTEFAGELLGLGQPLDTAKYYIIISDANSHGQSPKPADGLKTNFQYTTTTTWPRHSTS